MRRLSFFACAASFAAGCGGGGGQSAIDLGLPVATLDCPDHVQAGASFHCDGGASKAAPGHQITTMKLTANPGGGEVADLVGDFVIAAGDVATVTLVITDELGNNASASRRLIVEGDPAATDPDPTDPPPDTSDPPPDDTTDPPPPPPDDVHGDPVNLTGAFAMVSYDDPELHSDYDLSPAEQCAPTPTLSLVTLVQTDNHIDMTMQYCHLSLPTVQVNSFGVFDMEVPDDIPNSMDVIHAAWDVVRAETGVEFRPPLTQINVARVSGTVLADPDAALPGDQVSDDDNDGNNGVTIVSHSQNDGSDTPVNIVYRRAIKTFAGTITSSDVIDGSTPGAIRVASDSALLDWWTGYFIPTGEGKPSTFRMTRVDGGANNIDLRGSDGQVTCDDLRGNFQQLVGAVAPPPMAADCPVF